MIQIPETSNTLEATLSLILVPIFIILLLGISVYSLYMYLTDKFDFFPLGISITTSVLALLVGVGLWWGMYPWRAEYHQWRAVDGEVQTIDKRLVSTGDKSMEDKFVVTFKGNPQEYGVLDTRAASVRPGERLVITCVKRWQYSGTHGYDCNYVGKESK